MEYRTLMALTFVLIVIIWLIIRLAKPDKRQHTTLVFYHSHINIKKMELLAKQFLDTNLGLVDHDTQEPIEATFSNVTLASSDAAVFTTDTDVDADGVFDVVGISEGSAVLTVTADVSYTDKNTELPVTASKTATIDVTVSAPAPEAESVDLVVTFSAPKPVPATA